MNVVISLLNNFTSASTTFARSGKRFTERGSDVIPTRLVEQNLCEDASTQTTFNPYLSTDALSTTNPNLTIRVEIISKTCNVPPVLEVKSSKSEVIHTSQQLVLEPFTQYAQLGTGTKVMYSIENLLKILKSNIV